MIFNAGAAGAGDRWDAAGCYENVTIRFEIFSANRKPT